MISADQHMPMRISLCLGVLLGILTTTFGAGVPVAGPFETQSLRLAVTDLTSTFGKGYPKGKEYLDKLDRLDVLVAGLSNESKSDQEAIRKQIEDLRREALLANPLLDFGKLLLVKRRPYKNGKPGNPDAVRGWDIGFPRSSYGKTSLKRNALESEIAILSPVRPDGAITTIYRPDRPRFVGDVDLHFNGDRLLFTMRNDEGHFRIYEMGATGKDLRMVNKSEQQDVDTDDPCYLPNGDILFGSTACFQGVPCNKSKVSVLYRMNAGGGNIRQLCFEQDHDYHPTITENGRVMYLRWEYSDLPHTYSRIMFHMNPDGTGQMELYGSNSYWPNGIYNAKPIPGKPTMFIGVVAGHHDCYRSGELVLFDVARGRHEAQGAVQKIPGYGKAVKARTQDKLTAETWPKFAHPFPLSSKYFLTTCKLSASSPWDVYLVDVFDNMVRLAHAGGWGLLEPIPLRERPEPPVIPDKVDPTRKDALVYLVDIYRGPGLKGVPRGAIRKLRLITYHFCYQGLGGQYERVGLDGPWDVKQVLGTVPVEADGSAAFRIPANLPISVQPLDAEGKAVQLMRSWLVGMPGEVVSCVGCHEKQNTSPPAVRTIASQRAPSEITSFYGPRRGFSFKREVQPVLDRYCIGCHDGSKRSDERVIPDLRAGLPVRTTVGSGRFSPSYMALRRLVRSPTIEPDMHMLTTGDFHADSTELIQNLTKGHHGVKLDAESWDRLITWVDLHTPAHGTWREIAGDKKVLRQRDRRRACQKLYAGRDEDPEDIAEPDPKKIKTVMPGQEKGARPRELQCQGWPFDGTAAKLKQKSAKRSIDLGDGIRLELVMIPGGKFIMGSTDGHADERPRTVASVGKSFWMGACEISNRQYALFDPKHDSRLEHGDSLQFEETARGFAMNEPLQPVVRVSWTRAKEFCEWLSAETGISFDLPTEAQWEYACRAGSSAPMWYGNCDTEFGRYANLADARLKQIVSYGGYDKAANVVPCWRPCVDQVNDGFRVAAKVGTYQANVWGLHDMHGNVREWTRSLYRPYPYSDDDGRNDPADRGKRVARGGSWYDRPQRATSAFRLAYQPWLGVYDVGFRVVAE
ncbi:MAG: SUMF1/EgtB/PvdO family nonheme iron enzyme [Kiritimatiellia bacterium]|jgi:formylglycine-generating enzyme required for sulfatase activity|nr:SUMF1/EgtB/PvdO family nonheme iron enzyme [Kiritimatiellia bacterium]